MPFQAEVGFRYAQGMVGEQAFDTPIVVKTWRIKPHATLPALIGLAYQFATDEVVEGVAGTNEAILGGSGKFAGLAINPKNGALYGTNAGGPLAPSIRIPDNDLVQLATKGQWFVYGLKATAFGDKVYFTANGELTNEAGSSPANTEIVGARFIHKTTTDGALTIVDLG